MSPLRVKRIAPTGTERIRNGSALKAKRAKREIGVERWRKRPGEEGSTERKRVREGPA